VKTKREDHDVTDVSYGFSEFPAVYGQETHRLARVEKRI
jgi:hypothetical protein